MISSAERYEKKRVPVLGSQMAYVEVGEGDPIVFLHGNPTSSYLWRNVIPQLADRGRCIAPDLIGMGDSDKLAASGPSRYRFAEHRHYLDALLDQLALGDRITLVIHDWGSALGFDWARRHPARVRGIAYMEALVAPLRWSDWPPEMLPLFKALRSPAGEELVLEQNVFVDQILPGAILRALSVEERAVYRRPYLKPGEDRRPTLTWPRELPIDGEPADVVSVIVESGRWLERSQVPKLFINADPGAILLGRAREYCRTWPHQQEVTVRGAHFVQEDSPDEIGQAIRAWVERLGR
ncbi:MAG: haloalkane dehalogenase [Myxococcota bacterium]